MVRDGQRPIEASKSKGGIELFDLGILVALDVEQMRHATLELAVLVRSYC